MIRLQGHSLTPGERFTPESMSLNLAERNSTASMKIAANGPALAVGEWLMDNTEPGKGIIWRVKTIETDYGGETLTVTLEHIINTLKDKIMFGEVKPSDMGGDNERCYAQQAMQYILSKQSVWQYGGIEYDQAEEFNFNGDSLFDALETVSSALADCWWEYDLSVYPFKLYIKRQTTATVSEMRMSRNISSIRKTIDRSRMYTRFYPIGKNNLHITGDYVQENTETWGVVCKTETNNALDTEGKLRSWANDRLHRHSTPAVTITISGLDMSAATGESLDHIRLGGMCRAPLPEYGTTITERVIKIAFRDKINEPENITVTLSNALEDIASIINSNSKSSGSGGRAGAKNDEEDHAWFIDTESHVGMIAEAIIGQGQSGVDWSRVASIIVDGYGIHDRVVLAEGDIVLLRSEIEITESHWRATFEDNMNSLRSEIEMSASHLRSLFEDEVNSLRGEFEVSASHMRTEFTDEVNSLRSELEITASGLRSEFENEAESIRSELTQTASEIRAAVNDEANSIRSELSVTASAIRAEVSSEAESIRSEISQERNRISLVVEGTGADATVKRSAIILAINNGTSSAHIDADEVYIGNQKSTTVINGKCVLSDVTADYIAGKIATIPTLSGITANFSGNITSGGALSGYQVYADSRNISNPVMHVALLGPTNNVYTLVATKADGTYNEMSFSRAVSSWTMGWSGGKFTAKANPQDQSCNTTLVQGTTSWDGNVATVPVDAYDSDNPNYTYATGRSVVVDASSIFSAGRTEGVNAAKPVSGTAGGRTSGVSALVHDFTITKGDGSTVTLQIDVSSIYTTARSGYTLGTFTLADITLQGDADNVYKEVSSGGTNYYTAGSAKNDRGDSVTAREVLSSGGTVFYAAGTAKTYYDAGTAGTYYDAGTAVTVYPGNGGSFTPQGSAGPRLKDDGTARHYDVNGNLIGNHHWYHAVSSGGTQYYNAGSGTKYARGTGYSITPIGTAHTITPVGAGHVVTPIGSTSVRLGSAGTYYKGNGGSFTPVSGSPKMLAATTRYKAGTRYQSTYYTKS